MRGIWATLRLCGLVSGAAWGCGDSSGPGGGNPTPDYQLTKSAGDNQSDVPGAVLALSLVVKYSAPNGDPAPATTVTWSGAGLASATTTTSASTGTSSNQWTIPALATPGTPITVTATIAGSGGSS